MTSLAGPYGEFCPKLPPSAVATFSVTAAWPAALRETTSRALEAFEVPLCVPTGRDDEVQLVQTEPRDDKLTGFIRDLIDSFCSIFELA